MEDERERYEVESLLADRICSFVDPERYHKLSASREVAKHKAPPKAQETSNQQRDELKGLISQVLKRDPYQPPEDDYPTL